MVGNMSRSNLDKRFFESTRGQIVLLIRAAPKTVNELAADLDLTDNAVRAHLLVLERDGLVEQGSMVKGYRRPHYSYVLTDAARNLFPKPYSLLFGKLLEVMKGRMAMETFREVLSDLGRKIGKEAAATGNGGLDSRIALTKETLEAIGGAPSVERHGDVIEIKSGSCPFADAVAEHPEVCCMAESLVGEIVQRPVRETCDRTGTPKCSFEIDAGPAERSRDN